MLSVVLWLGIALLCVVVVVGVYLWRSLVWLRGETRGDRYFARPIAERRALKDEIARRSRVFVPVCKGLAPILPRPRSKRYRGVAFSTLACPRKVFEAATRYAPVAGDLFVATQMKCGTTWMQQVVYETLMRGRGDLSDAGHHHMYALSPWIESGTSVSMEDAPRVGPHRQRIIKTHLPTDLCPYSEEARYVYVARNPVACFASCVDFETFLAGPFASSAEKWADVYCSDDMWWRPWPDHVEGWWRWAERPNVLFVHYEQMLADLGAQIDRVAEFLDVELDATERSEVVRKSEFGYMKENEEVFEMTPPNFFSIDNGAYLASGRADRDRDASLAQRERIHAFCRERLKGAKYPLGEFYPEVAEARA